MTDDIVTRLRKAVAQTAEVGTLPSWDFAIIVWEAAHEIERLRRDRENHGGPLSLSGYRGARADDTSLAAELEADRDRWKQIATDCVWSLSKNDHIDNLPAKMKATLAFIKAGGYGPWDDKQAVRGE